MAGDGIRFNDTDHEQPKPLIEVVDGKTMIELVVDCLTPRIEHRFIFICRSEHDEEYPLDELFAGITTRYKKALVDEITEGPACSVLLAKPWIDNDEPMLTACSDDYVNADINDFLKFSSESDAEGTIMTYPGTPPGGSYARINNEGLVTKVAEKKIIGPNTTVGIYYFAKGSYFVDAAEQMIRDDIRVNGEFYVCPVFNEMIVQGQTINAYEIDAKDMHTMGTPDALRAFQKKLQSHPEIIS